LGNESPRRSRPGDQPQLLREETANQKPTNLKSTETKRPTVNPGVILDKGETGDGNKNGILFVTGAAIIVSIVVLYLYLTRKTR